MISNSNKTRKERMVRDVAFDMQLACERSKITAEMYRKMGDAFREGKSAASKINLNDPWQFFRLTNSFKMNGANSTTVNFFMKQAGVYAASGQNHKAYDLLQNAKHFMGRAIALGRE